MKLKIYLNISQKILFEGLSLLISRQKDFELVEPNIRPQIVALSSDVVIVDLLNDANITECLDFITEVYSNAPGIRILVITNSTNRRYLAGTLVAGAVGFLCEDCSFNDFVNAIFTVCKNKLYLKSLGYIIPYHTDLIAKCDSIGLIKKSLLTKRETEILILISDGKSTKECAVSLSVSPKTIEAFRQKIMKKLQINNITEMVKYSLRAGLIAL